jgi:L-lactate dehydrogenase complex protein LldF
VSGVTREEGTFREIARLKLADARVGAALDLSTSRLMNGRVFAWGALDGAQELRERAHEARMRVIDDLDGHIVRFRGAVASRGGKTFLAGSAADANAYIVDVCRNAGAKLAAKSKSMATEEIGLNEALEAAGVRAVETDLGEYILQLAGEHPVHIIAPAIEKTKEDVAELLSEVDGRPVAPDLEELTRAARRQLRETFHAADVGITGANFGVCDTGSIVLVTNEGNGRLVSSLPRVHVVLMGMERLVASLSDLAVLLRLLARSGTGQRLSTYTTLITGPRREGEQDGPDELHVVILDNGRSKLTGGRYREMLACIRCGACLNVCPVYRKTGGAAYGPVYSGPMGAVLVPLLAGLEQAPDLPHASSLCGACSDACPVKIPLHELLLELRRDLVEQGIAPFHERLAFRLWSYAWSSPAGYRLTTWLARLGGPFAGLVGPGRSWREGRKLPKLGPRYRDRR